MRSSLVPRRAGRGRRRALVALGLVPLGLLATYAAFRCQTSFSPPSPPANFRAAQVLRTAPLPSAPAVTRLAAGGSSLERRDSVWLLRLRGSPWEAGHSHGLLVRRLSDRFEQHMRRVMRRHAPSALTRWAVQNLIRWRYRYLPRLVAPQHLQEMAAFASALADTEQYAEPAYQRLLYYHAMYDITQRLEGSPLLACTAFAAWGASTVDGRVLIGRNFDFDAGRIFDRHKAVQVFVGPGAIPFMSVGWPGLLGVVTGVNAARIFVSLNAARTDDAEGQGVPIVLTLRTILERATSIADAVRIVRDAPRIGAQSVLVVDGKRADAAVIESSPTRVALRAAEGTTIAVTNHLLHPQFAADADNDRLRRYTSSASRYQRLRQLLARHDGRIDGAVALSILRDRQGLDDKPLAVGHGGTIAQLGATHSIVLDLSRLVLWVSRGPGLLGRYVPFALEPLFASAKSGGPLAEPAVEDLAPLPADQLLISADRDAFAVAAAEIAYAERLRRREQRGSAVDHATRAVKYAPELPRARLVLAELLWQEARWSEAKAQYRAFLALAPSDLAAVERARRRLAP